MENQLMDAVLATETRPSDTEEWADEQVIKSLLAVHRILESELPRGRLAIYEAGGGSTSYIPPTLLARGDVTVVDVDERQIERCSYATTKRVADIQTLRLPPSTFDLV